ncbi:hypothetical protein JD82_02753 [Prauserella rugosa]|uniref:Uncharacterized protein n=1 Tax=Prauserella rugosa TaxID=43354 RepID=A0A660CBP4_9PSEU|nr:hypothetical protein JD82_02753 [Prauserella rugosa]
MLASCVAVLASCARVLALRVAVLALRVAVLAAGGVVLAFKVAKVKGAAADPDYALERAALEIIGAKDAH